MIRVIQRRLIIPRGDTGTFTVPALSPGATGSVGVFTIFDPITKIRVFQKKVDLDGDVFNIEFGHGDTVNLQAGDYLWDIKFYKDPVIENGKVISGTEIDSYYAAFQTPKCEIRETGDDFMTIEGTPVKVEDLNIILAATQAANAAKVAAEASATEAAEKLAQMIAAIPTKVSDLVDDSGHYTKPAEGIPVSDLADGVVPVQDVQIAGTSIVSNSAANIPLATNSTFGVVSADPQTSAIGITNGLLKLLAPSKSMIRAGESLEKTAVISQQHISTFYGLAKAAGADDKDSGYSVGTYSTTAQAAIRSMLGAAAITDIPTVPTNVSAFTNDAGYLTQHQDISGKADIADVAVVPGAGVGSAKTRDFIDSGTEYTNRANGLGSFAEGLGTGATGVGSHAEGMASLASGYESHAEGYATQSTANATHAEGLNTVASANGAHAEGLQATASGRSSHAEGNLSVASGKNSHSEGLGTIAASEHQHVQGKYNVSDSQKKYTDIVGNGTTDDARSNAFALTWTGDGKYAGDVYINCNTDSSGGTKVLSVADFATDLDIQNIINGGAGA